MTIEKLIALCERRLVYLSQLKTTAEALGDIEQIEKLNQEIAETNSTKNSLLTLI